MLKSSGTVAAPFRFTIYTAAKGDVMPAPNWNWIKKMLKSGASVAVRVTGVEITRRCVNCALDKIHAKHEDQAGTAHYFCKTCGTHN
jgi:hypothetical protein